MSLSVREFIAEPKMGFSRLCFLLCFSLGFLICGTFQLQSSQIQVLLQLRKQLEYPKQLDYWLNKGIDLCYFSSPQVNLSCQDNFISEIRIYGDMQTRASAFDGFPIPYQTLSQNFSMDSLLATLSRLNSLRSLSLVSLGIWGPIPVKIHRLQFLEYLDLSWNFFYGSIPQTLPRIVNLEILKLDGNFLNDTFPNWLDSFSNLTSLSLKNNQIYGPIPASLGRATSLMDINLSNNQISGKLPDLRSLSSLNWLDLSNNKLDSELPIMPKGITAVLLSNNSFSGRIPKQYGELNNLQQLDLSFNALQGTTPSELFTLPNITSLNLASNMLIGSLPSSLSCGSSLGLVDFSNNRLKGVLPSCLSSDLKTRVVKFGGNCLSIDLEHQHPEAYCVENSSRKKNSKGKTVGILAGVICGIMVILATLAFGFLVLCRQYCPHGSSEQQLLHKSVQDNSVKSRGSELITNARFISDAAKLGTQDRPAHRLFSIDELKEATNNFDDLALMGEGSNGKIYKGRLENRDQVAVRCLKVSKRYTIRNLKLRLDLLAKLRHPHLVCLLGHCIKIEGKDEAGVSEVYLIYEYIPHGNYQARLSETSSQKVIRWPDRLAILIGIAKAVHFLHNGIIPGFFSNQLKAKNILLIENGIGKLRDYGLSVVADQKLDKDKEESGGLKSWQIKNLEDDIYSFGMILLESLVAPSVRARKESFVLNEMVSLGNPDCIGGIVDPIVLASCCQESLSIVISLTINSISPESSTRPSFEDVLWNLQYAAQVQATSDGEQRIGKLLQSLSCAI
ncbi:putative inactive leucine-rich repeat receptor-like protein kinase At3g03770 isoform X2 [Primulina tabacum]|uniref:putative inactive leucine-rich repeat receptor-like protein kinase At3g03770 isoform X2 n=1 Tax=Primulina tabacum TaxID=48773 RepID=UPI003F592F2C